MLSRIKSLITKAVGPAAAVTESVALGGVAGNILTTIKPSFYALGALLGISAATTAANTDTSIKMRIAGAIPGTTGFVALFFLDGVTRNGIAMQPVLFSAAVSTGFLLNFLRVAYANSRELKDYALTAIGGIKTAAILTLLYDSKEVGGNLEDSAKGQLSTPGQVAAWVASGCAALEAGIGIATVANERSIDIDDVGDGLLSVDSLDAETSQTADFDKMQDQDADEEAGNSPTLPGTVGSLNSDSLSPSMR